MKSSSSQSPDTSLAANGSETAAAPKPYHFAIRPAIRRPATHTTQLLIPRKPNQVRPFFRTISARTTVINEPSIWCRVHHHFSWAGSERKKRENGAVSCLWACGISWDATSKSDKTRWTYSRISTEPGRYTSQPSYHQTMSIQMKKKQTTKTDFGPNY